MFVPAATLPGYRTLFVAPTEIHMSLFAHDKLSGTLRASPLLQRMLGKAIVDNVKHKEFENGSSILLRAAYLTARSARGIPADQLLIDEAQEMIPDHLPVLAETLTHSHQEDFGRRIVVAGTANTPDAMIGDYWERFSSQGEWVIRCKKGHPNTVQLENLDERGLICTRKIAGGTCGEVLDPRNGQWEHMYPSRAKEGLYVGFRIPQPINPTVHAHWDEFWAKIKTYTTADIYMEVLGISYEAGTKPISIRDLRKCETKLQVSTAQEYIERPVMGIDWGEGEVSFTVVTIGGWNQRNKFQVIFAKRFRLGQEVDPLYQAGYILDLARRFGVVMIGADWGGGWTQNTILRNKFGRVVEFVYSHSLKHELKYAKGTNKYTANRSATMTSLFEAIRGEGFEFYDGYVDEFGPDFDAVTATKDKLGRVLYVHSVTKPDDAVHSLNYAYIIGRLMRKDLKPVVSDVKNAVSTELELDDLL